MWSLVSSLPNPHYSNSSTSSRDSRSQSRKRSATTTTTGASASISASSESLGLHYNEPSSAFSGTRKIHTSSSAAVSSFSSRPPTAPAYSTASSSTIDLGLGGLSELLEPAIDGPPSPERLRALSNQMRQASMASRSSSTSRAERATLSRHAPTSSTSSLRSIVSSSNWPSWEPLTIDTNVSSLSRKSSSRSTISSLRHSTVKERPDSGVQAFGKAIFQGRGRLRREHSDLGIGSAASSMSPLSNDLSTFEAFPSAPTSAGVTSPSSFTSESRFPSIFSRRRSAKPDDPTTPMSSTTSPIRKYNISGPYNFQHLTHTNRDDLPALPATSRVELVNEFSSFNAAHRTATMPELSPGLTDRPIALSTDEPQVQQPKQILSSPAEIGHRRIMSGSRSSSTDQLRSGPPPRPPRPAESLFPLLCSPLVSAPMPPPRVSSRSSNQPEGIELAFDRPATANSLTLPEAMSISLAGVPSGCHFSHAITTPDDVAWPMPSPTSPPLFEKLADVPEEEEYFNRSHISFVDIHEHLRENASAPTPREMAGPHPSSPGVSTRPCSAGSDTLGYLSHSTEDIAAETASLAIASTDSLPTDDSQSTDTTIASPQLQAEVHAVDAAISGSWEDDIDYAYDHEVEADCSYEWKRTSLDIRIERQESEDYQDAVSSDTSAAGYCDVTIAHLGLHHVMTGLAISSPSASSVPALSPTSPATATLATTSAVTPVSATSTTNPFAPPQPPVLSNFSLPRSAHGRSNSSTTLSTFRESQGFTLSPSLLIPADYRQQMMMLAEVDDDDEADAPFAEDEADADALFIHDPRANFEVKFNARKNRMSSVYRPSPDRTSTSTMTTLSTVASSDISTVATNLSSERHVSASTTMTRMTCNSDIMGDWSPVSDAGVVLGVEPTEVDFLRLGSSTGDLPATAKAIPTVPLRRRALTTSSSTSSFSIFPIPRSQPHQV
ncbi:hypothetical protein HOO65_050342 [Ceratocystis lukuohia]|uniref:CRIB domain-containing protein n=1 Tax=Ceratocystis lukuohia TaxID=2019550 RepID=A0ABR4MG09_9PEZI